MALDPQTLQQQMFAFIKSGLLRTAVDLELFTHIAHGRHTAPEIARAAGADERAVRIVLDALTAQGLVTKSGNKYGLDPVVEAMLVKDSPAYAGAFTRITLNPRLWSAVGKLTDVVRSGKPPAVRDWERLYDQPSGGWFIPGWMSELNRFTPGLVEEWLRTYRQDYPRNVNYAPVELEVANFYYWFCRLTRPRRSAWATPSTTSTSWASTRMRSTR